VLLRSSVLDSWLSIDSETGSGIRARAIDNVETMSEQPERLTLLQQREIEAKVLAPFVRAVAVEIGQDRAVAILRGVIENLAREAGADYSRSIGEATLTAFAGMLSKWTEGGALELKILEQNDERLSFDVTRCRYAELYNSLGLADLGSSLSCCRDAALSKGFNPDIHLTRTQTIMEGASHCDFRFARKNQPD
jgi:L-2-amino-thiazoline-4-carboxylic acid hydrolase